MDRDLSAVPCVQYDRPVTHWHSESTYVLSEAADTASESGIKNSCLISSVSELNVPRFPFAYMLSDFRPCQRCTYIPYAASFPNIWRRLRVNVLWLKEFTCCFVSWGVRDAEFGHCMSLAY